MESIDVVQLLNGGGLVAFGWLIYRALERGFDKLEGAVTRGFDKVDGELQRIDRRLDRHGRALAAFGLEGLEGPADDPSGSAASSPESNLSERSA